MDNFIPQGWENYVAALREARTKKLAALNEQLKAETEPARRDSLSKEIERVGVEYDTKIRESRDCLYFNG